jgi:hypothetical protein
MGRHLPGECFCEPESWNRVFGSKGFLMISYGKLFTMVGLAILSMSAAIQSAKVSETWQSGRVVAVEISGQGTGSQPQARREYGDLWWTYNICAGDRTFRAALRESPTRSGLRVNSLVKLSAGKTQINALDSHGKRHILRIIRVDMTRGCRQQPGK